MKEEFVWYLYQTTIGRSDDTFYGEIIGIFENFIDAFNAMENDELLCRVKLNHRYGKNDWLHDPCFWKDKQGKMWYSSKDNPWNEL